MKLQEHLIVKDELTLYLVAQGVKPTTIIDFSLNIDQNVLIYDFLSSFPSNKEPDFYRLRSSIIAEFNHLLDSTGVAYKGRINPRYDNLYQILAGKDQESFHNLQRATTDREIGLALGFPQEAVDALGKIIDGEMRDGSYYCVSLAKAQQAGLEIPTWLAYISFIPEQLDFVNGKISQSSERLGRRYQDFVHKHNSDLARRVEEEFVKKEYPKEWKKLPDGSYEMMKITC